MGNRRDFPSHSAGSPFISKLIARDRIHTTLGFWGKVKVIGSTVRLGLSKLHECDIIGLN